MFFLFFSEGSSKVYKGSRVVKHQPGTNNYKLRLDSNITIFPTGNFKSSLQI